jgi:hypothetical protein
MGLVDDSPVAFSRTGQPVAIWDGAHHIVNHSTAVNVSCELVRPNGVWYRLWKPAGSVAANEYVSAALTRLDGGPPGYVWAACTASDDQPGRGWPTRAVLRSVVLTALIGAATAAVIIKRRRPRPDPPPVRER